VLEYPDFIEFDDLNGVIVTKHDVEKVCRVWSMRTLKMLYVVTHPGFSEFKICNGMLILIFKEVAGSLPMILLDVFTGKAL